MRIESIMLRPFAIRDSLRGRLPVAAVLALVVSCNAWADEYLDPIGGQGGGRFEAHCPAGQYLAGFQLRAGDDVDAIRPLCVVAHGPREVGPAASESNWYGGTGGGSSSVACTMYKPVVTGMFVAAEGEATVVVNNIHLFCGLATDAQEASDSPSALFDAPKYDAGSLNSFIGGAKGTQHCPAGQVAVGVHGRSGIWVDAIGLICGDAPRTATVPAPPKVKELRTSTTALSPGHAATAPGASSSTTQANRAAAYGIHSAGQATTSTSLPPVGPEPPPPPPSAPSPPPASPASASSSGSEAPSSRASRDAAVAALIGTIAAGIGESRRDQHDDPYRRRDQGANVSLQQPAQPENSIRVEVRYPAAYGYRDAAGVSDPGPNSCGAFYISSFPLSGIRPREPAQIATTNRMRSSNGAYVCDYLISGLSLNQPIAVRVAMSDQRAAGSEVWLGGSQAQPPTGRRRTIVEGDRQVLLTAERPRAALRFEMTYAGSP